MIDKKTRIVELINIINNANKAYYAQANEVMSNKEYDALYDELLMLERETAIILANSPTQSVGYEVLTDLEKIKHDKPMLSLSKTKEREELRSFLLDKSGVLSWKLDGLTIVLTYIDGQLNRAVTRGNGEVGELVTSNAKVFKNIPLSIPYKGQIVLRGEAIIAYSDFEIMNSKIVEGTEKFKNPRNLCSGSVRQLNSEVTAQRNVSFYAFSLVSKEGDGFTTRSQEMEFLREQGFGVVPYKVVSQANIIEAIEEFSNEIIDFDLPSDGLVLCFQDIEYGVSLGVTAKFPKDAMAFKWADEIRETKLIDIEWSASRTGLINPVAIFEPVELEGTTVSRASVHNVSVVKSLALGINDIITVYKANMIIPQIDANLTKSNTIIVPTKCPVCGKETIIKKETEVETLYCSNIECPAKKIKAFTLFVSRNALNIDGLSEATLEKFISYGYIHDFVDLFYLERYKDSMINLEGFGVKSYNNLMKSIETSRKTTLAKVIYALGISGIGLATAKLVCKFFEEDLEKLILASREEMLRIDGVGEVLAESFIAYMSKEENTKQLRQLIGELEIEKDVLDLSKQNLAEHIIVITGSLEQFENRNALKEILESRGAKVTGSVTNKTTLLINNDNTSNSSKNKKAKELGIAIITEEELISKYLVE